VDAEKPETTHIFLDVSDLEPPEPLVRVLAKVESLRKGEYMHVRHRREPCLLYPNLEKKGFDYMSCSNGSDFHIFIWRKEDVAAESAVRAAIAAICRG